MQIFVSLNKNLYVNLFDKKQIDDVKMKFERYHKVSIVFKQIVVVQVCLNFEWCQFAFF